jgi:hypothetical protein
MSDAGAFCHISDIKAELKFSTHPAGSVIDMDANNYLPFDVCPP